MTKKLTIGALLFIGALFHHGGAASASRLRRRARAVLPLQQRGAGLSLLAEGLQMTLD